MRLDVRRSGGGSARRRRAASSIVGTDVLRFAQTVLSKNKKMFWILELACVSELSSRRDSFFATVWINKLSVSVFLLIVRL